MALTDTQRDILNAAAEHAKHLASPPRRLPMGARQSVAKALLRQGLVSTVDGPVTDAAAVWTVDGASVWLQATEQGINATRLRPAVEPSLPSVANPVLDASTSVASGRVEIATEGGGIRPSLRSTAVALLTAWDASSAQDTTGSPVSRALEAFRMAVQAEPRRPAGQPSTQRQGTKQEAVLALLRRPEGATIAQVMEATGWQQHTVRGFFAGLKRRQGINVTVLERVRQVGPGAQGSRGSHSIYAVVL